MYKKSKIAEAPQEDQPNKKKTDTSFSKVFKAENFNNVLVIAVLVIIGTIIWFAVFDKILVQYLPAWAYLIVLFVSTFIVSTFFSKAVKDDKEKQRKLVKWMPILLVFIFNFLPSLDRANFSPEGEVLNWINIENGMIFHRPSNEIHQDSKGEYFFDPITGDTCRKATEHWREIHDEKSHNDFSTPTYITEYDTLVDKVYSVEDLNEDHYINTHVYGYDINALQNPIIVVINIKGEDDSSVVIARVKKDKKIYASYRNPVVKYKYTKELTTDVDASVAIDIKGDSKARVLLLNKKRVIAQN